MNMSIANVLVIIISLIACGFIGYNFIQYKKYSEELNEYFGGMLEEIKSKRFTNSSFQNENLNKIVKEFRKSLVLVSDVNTQVIIEKNLYPEDEILKIKESKLEYMANLSTILGLLGTFLGLTVAIFSIGFTLNSTDIKNFLAQLKPAISGMGGAFITSIIGLMGSICMNLLYGNYRIAKQNLIDEIEDYLDNEEARNKINDTKYLEEKLDQMVGAIYKMSDNIEISSKEMHSLVTDISELNQEMKSFNVNIKQNSENLNEATENFSTAIAKFEEPLRDFRGSIDGFISTYNGMDDKVEKLNKLINESFSDVVDVFIEKFESNTNAYIENTEEHIAFMEKNSDVQSNTLNKMQSMCDSISKTTVSLKDTYSELNNIIESIENNIVNEQNSFKQIESQLTIMLQSLQKEINGLGSKVAREISSSVSISMENSTSEAYNLLSSSMKNIVTDFENSQEEIKENLSMMRDTIMTIYNQVIKLQEINLSK